MFSATYKTGPAIGPNGRGHVHEYECPMGDCSGLGVASEATWWSTARSGGRYGLGADETITITPGQQDIAQHVVVISKLTYTTLGGAMLGAFLGAFFLGGSGRLIGAAGATGGAMFGGYLASLYGKTFVDKITIKALPERPV